jgi:hypothetical protein
MFSNSYLTVEERRVYEARAAHLRAAAVAGLFRDLARWVSSMFSPVAFPSRPVGPTGA